MQKTPKLGLIKPTQEDHYNIDDFNANADIVDSGIEKLTPIVSDVDLTAGVSPLESGKLYFVYR